MRWFTPLRTIALVAVALWVASIVLPGSLRVDDYMLDGRVDPKLARVEDSWDVLLLGWLGPLSIDNGGRAPPGYEAFELFGIWGSYFARWAWYANPLWLWNIIRMFNGKQPRPLVALASAVLGVVGLHAYSFWALSDHDYSSAVIPRAGAFLWAAIMAVPLFVWLSGRLLARRRVSADSL